MQRPTSLGSPSPPKQPPLPTPTSQSNNKTIPTISKTVTLPILRSNILQIGELVKEDKGIALHTGVYDGRAIMVQRMSAEAWIQHQNTWVALYQCQSPFWLTLLGMCEQLRARVIVMAAPPDTRFSEWLRSTAADAWPLCCRLVRDVAVGLYQRRVVGAAHVTWDARQLFLDKEGRAQLIPLVSETPVTEADEVYALGQFIWQVVSRKMELTKDWQKGKGLLRDCPPAVMALIQACTDPVISARPSLKAVAKGLDAFWQRAEQGLLDATPALPAPLSSEEKDKKYDLPASQSSAISAYQVGDLLTGSPLSGLSEIKKVELSLADEKARKSQATPSASTASMTPSVSLSLTNSVLASGSLNLLLIDDQKVSWLNYHEDPRYQVGVKLCALRDSLVQPMESKASLPTLQQTIQTTLIDDSPVEMLLWLGEEGEDPNHSFIETAWRLWQTPAWQAYRPGDPPPTAWLPLFINLHHSSIHSPLFTHNHQLTSDGIADFTETEWQVVEQHYRPFWLVQGIEKLDTSSNLYDTNALHRAQNHVRLLLHSRPSHVFKLEESTTMMPHGADGRLFPSRYARYTTEDLSAWEGRYQGEIGPAAQATIAPDTTSLPLTLTPEKDLALHRDQLILPSADDSKNTLGKGAFGEVLWGTYYGQPVAVKWFKETKLSSSQQAQLKDEAAVMANLHSPFLISLLGLSLESPPLLVMELAPGGSLFHLLKDGNQALAWS